MRTPISPRDPHPHPHPHPHPTITTDTTTATQTPSPPCANPTPAQHTPPLHTTILSQYGVSFLKKKNSILPSVPLTLGLSHLPDSRCFLAILAAAWTFLMSAFFSSFFFPSASACFFASFNLAAAALAFCFLFLF